MADVFIGRQPIFTANLEEYAYELLFRRSEHNQADVIDAESATAEVVLNAFTEIGLQRITGSLPAFLNATRAFLLEGHAYALPSDRVVIEVLEDIEPDQALLQILTELKESGFSIALDDVVYRAELRPLLELADVIKVEFPAVSREQLAEHVAIYREYSALLLAEKIETHEEFDFCRELGFDLFQGYFLSRPNVVQAQTTPINRVALLNLIARLQSSSVSVADVVDVVSTEPSLSYKLLRFANSAYCALATHVESIQHAVAIAGMRRIKTFASLSLLTKVAEEKPLPLIRLALTRGKMCELLAARLRLRLEPYFLVGLFSTLDALLDKPLEEALELVSLASELNQALLSHEGRMGSILQCVIDYEQGNWDQVERSEFDSETLRSAYLDAIQWTSDVTSNVRQAV